MTIGTYTAGIATKAVGEIPIGYAGDFWVLARAGCEPVKAEGGVVPKRKYPGLYAVLATAYPEYESPGDTFRLPDFQARVVER